MDRIDLSLDVNQTSQYGKIPIHCDYPDVVKVAKKKKKKKKKHE